MGSVQGTITNEDNQFYTREHNQWPQASTGVQTNQFYWSIGNTVSILTGTKHTFLFSPDFRFEDESWRFVLEKVTPNLFEPAARDSFLLKLENRTRNLMTAFHVQLGVSYRNLSSCRRIESDFCKVDFRAPTAEYKFIPEDFIANWLTISKNISTLQLKYIDDSRWMFSCLIFKSEDSYNIESPFAMNEKAEKQHGRLEDNSKSKLKINEKAEKQLERLEGCFEWKLKSAKKLQDDLKNLLHDEKNSDFVLKVEGREFKAHRIILSARSNFFAAMFDHDMAEKQTGVVTIKDCDPDVFQGLLEYIYTGDTCFSSERVASLYTVADRYQVLELKEECAKHIRRNLSVDSFCDVARMSLRYPELDMTEIISQFFQKNASDILSTSEWETFIQENPKFCNELFSKTLKPTH